MKHARTPWRDRSARLAGPLVALAVVLSMALGSPAALAAEHTTTTTTASTASSTPGGALIPSDLDPDELEAAADRDDGGSGVSLLVVALVGLAAGGVGAAVGWALARRNANGVAAPVPAVAEPAHQTVPQPVQQPVQQPTHQPPADPQASQHREVLVRSMIEIGGLVSSEAVRGQIVEELGRVGVTALTVQPGAAFDPHRHRGVQAVPAPDRDTDGTVAQCDRPGWADGDRVIQLPEVIVYRWEDRL